MNFVFFVLLNAVLLIRPEEIFPEISGMRLYLMSITLCTLTSLPGLLELLRPASWRLNPLTPCLLAYLVLFVFSGLPFQGFTIIESLGANTFKNGLYYILFLAIVDSVSRFKALLGWFVVIIGVTISLSVLQYEGYTNFEALKPYWEGNINPETGEFVGSIRLRASGIFSDPNDICQLLMIGSICCLACASFSSNWCVTSLWLLPIGLFAYAAILTHSRGGLLGILAGFAGMVFIRLGPRIGLFIAPVVVLAGVLAAGGRQANFEMDTNDTSQQRIHLWAESFIILFDKPLFLMTGVGSGCIVDELGLAAHNSFVQAYVETGLIGGTLFSCLIFIPLLVIFYLRKSIASARNLSELNDLFQLRIYVFGIITGFAVSCYSLTRNGAESTYLFLGLGACYVRLARDICPQWFKLDSIFFKAAATLGIAVFVFLKLFTRIMIRY